MSKLAPITVVSEHDDSILDMFPMLLSAEATPAQTIQVVTNISTRVVKYFQTCDVIPASTYVTLIPVLRAALPVYVAASPLFLNSDTALVRCSKDKSVHGPESVLVEWMGTNPATRSGFRGLQRRLIILDTVVATGDTILKLCDDLSQIPGSDRSVTVLCCYASPQAIVAVARHRAVHSIFVAHKADSVDENGYLVPYTNGDIGDKLFGKKETSTT